MGQATALGAAILMLDETSPTRSGAKNQANNYVGIATSRTMKSQNVAQGKDMRGQ